MKRIDSILLVDDESEFRENVADRLESRGFKVFQAESAEAGLDLFRQTRMDVALVDVQMPGMDGITLLGHLKEADPLVEVVVVTGQGSIETAVDAMRRGAYHYVTKPVRLAELEMVVRRALEKTDLSRKNQLYQENLRKRRDGLASDVVVHSPAMKKIFEIAEGLSKTDSPVLIDGETGTGKEVVAEWIHSQSSRREEPFVVINCGALTDHLLDSELFGHEKGAFTGATASRSGMIEMADGGTLLLDEIGDMASAAQVRLLRVLERGLYRRVGSSREKSANIRILAATHRDLRKLSEEGSFREDLYHRLNVFHLEIPPLRERRDDILPLAEHFLRPGMKLGSASRDLLSGHSWPGNVRELAHAMERGGFSAHLAGKEVVDPVHLGLSQDSAPRDILVSLEEAQYRHIQDVIEQLGGNRQQSAKVLGISERHLYRLLQQDKKSNPSA